MPGKARIVRLFLVIFLSSRFSDRFKDEKGGINAFGRQTGILNQIEWFAPFFFDALREGSFRIGK
jgi:hypothetical protein